MVINNVPALGQLEAVVQELDRFGVLLADKQRARMFVFELGELVDRSELFDELPRDYDTHGERERGDVSGHVGALAHQHLRRAADVAFAVFQEQHFEHLCIGAPDEIASELEQLLHPYLRSRMCGRIDVQPGASRRGPPVRARGGGPAGAPQGGCPGEPPARRGRVRPPGCGRSRPGAHRPLRSTGWSTCWCRTGTRRLAGRAGRVGCSPPSARAARPAASRCRRLEDVVEEAVDQALALRCRVEVCRGNADLDVLGRVGALLRF